MAEVPIHIPQKHRTLRHPFGGEPMKMSIKPQELPGTEIIIEPKTEPTTTPPSQDKKPKRGLKVAAGLMTGTLVVGGAVEGARRLFDRAEPTRSPAATAPASPSEKPTQKAKPTSAELRSQREVLGNINHFMKDFDRQDLSEWARTHAISSFAGGEFNTWRIPVWNHYATDGKDNEHISYRWGQENVKVAPSLSTIYIGQNETISYMGVNLGLYKKDGHHIVAVGMMPHTAFAPSTKSGEKVEKYVQFFDVFWPNIKYPNRNVYVKLKKIDGVYSDIGSGAQDTITMDRGRYLSTISTRVGEPIYIYASLRSGGFNEPLEDDLVNSSTLGLQGKNLELYNTMTTIQNQAGWIWTSALEQANLPSMAPHAGAGTLENPGRLL